LADVREILKPREIDVEVLGTDISPEIQAILKKWEIAVQRNAEWFLQYVKDNSGKLQRLPYHSKMGITEQEHQLVNEYLENIKFVPVAKGRLKFTSVSESQSRIENIEGLPGFDGILIDTAKNQAVTPWGTAVAAGVVHATKSWLGDWDGRTWKYKSLKAETGSITIIEIDIGKQMDTGLNVIHVRASVAENGTKKADVDSVIRFPD